MNGTVMRHDEARAVLELDPAASADDVRRAWRRVARESHPDRGGDPVAFERYLAAYRTLSRASPAGPVTVVPRAGAAALAARWLRRRRQRARHPRVH